MVINDKLNTHSYNDTKQYTTKFHLPRSAIMITKFHKY